VDLVQDMYDGVLAMLKAENGLEKGEEPDVNLFAEHSYMFKKKAKAYDYSNMSIAAHMAAKEES
jgi:hypothetical protein